MTTIDTMVSPRPEAVKLGPLKISISFEPLEGLLGEYDGEIRINDKLQGSDQALALLHELIHAFAQSYGFKDLEKNTRTLEMAIGAFILDNPSFMAYFLKTLHGSPTSISPSRSTPEGTTFTAI